LTDFPRLSFRHAFLMKNTLNFAFSASLSVFFIFSLTYLNDIALHGWFLVWTFCTKNAPKNCNNSQLIID